MTRRKYPIRLIPLTYTSGSSGDTVTSGTPVDILADRNSVKRAEFYPAYANGIRPELMFTIWVAEYNGEPRLSHEGKEYEIVRTFTGKDEREVELVCHPLDLVQTGLSRLRDTIEVWHNTFTTNGMGAQKQVPELLFTLPAEIKYNSGGESDSIETIEHRNGAAIVVKYRSGITVDTHLIIGGKRWDIVDIDNPYNRNETLVIKAERKMIGSA